MLSLLAGTYSFSGDFEFCFIFGFSVLLCKPTRAKRVIPWVCGCVYTSFVPFNEYPFWIGEKRLFVDFLFPAATVDNPNLSVCRRFYKIFPNWRNARGGANAGKEFVCNYRMMGSPFRSTYDRATNIVHSPMSLKA